MLTEGILVLSRQFTATHSLRARQEVATVEKDRKEQKKNYV